MNLRLLAVAVLGLFALSLSARSEDGGSGWQTDYQAALQDAVKTGRPILADFTGSDWCGWCIKLSQDTFSKPEFAVFAKENLVLLEVDFPQGKEQSAAVKKQNEELQRKFSVEGFPTLVLLDKNGKELARNVGYLKGGPAAMIAWIKKARSKP